MTRFALTALFSFTLAAGSALADQQVLDDMIIDGSLCVGQDCVNGETFYFDTVVLKENNLRIRFQDTSNSASFPTVDWVIEANSSSNGGQSYLAFVNRDAATTPFSVNASAGHGALTVNGDGVGLGVTPLTNLHLSDSDTPTVRVEQNGLAGWPAQVWDLGANETNFFLRDSNSSTVPLRITAGAIDDALVVGVNGDLTIAGTLQTGSSRDVKHGVVPVDSDQILAAVASLEVNRWRYLADDTGAEHIGPMAEDFHRVFGFGADNRHIATADVAGVAVSSVQALHRMLERQGAELVRLRRANAQLEARLARLEAAFERR